MFPEASADRGITQTEYTEQATVLRHLALPDLIERAAMLLANRRNVKYRMIGKELLERAAEMRR